jgi:putative membrane protein
VGEGYWERLRDRMVERLRSGAAREAVLEAVAEVGAVLAREFPRRPDDVDELPDTVSLGP